MSQPGSKASQKSNLPLRVLFVLEYYYPHVGGVETLFKSLVEKLVEDGVKVTILTNKFKKGLPFKEEIGSLKIYRVPFLNRYIFTVLGCIPAFFLAFKNDIIHTTSYNAGIPAFFAGFLTRTKTIITFHEVWGDLWYSLPYMSKIMQWGHYTFEQMLLKLPFHKFVAVSEATKNNLIHHGIPPKDVLRIYNGMDYAEFATYTKDRTETNDSFTFIYYGRLGISKGFNKLLEGLHILNSKGVDFKLNLVIPQEPKAMYNLVMDFISEHKLEHRVTLYHDLSRSELFSLVTTSDCTVVPSYSEGFGYTALESVALGVPVIISPNGSLPEVISGKYIMMNEFSGEGLAEAMQSAIQGKFDFKINRNFSLEESVRGYQDMYNTYTQ